VGPLENRAWANSDRLGGDSAICELSAGRFRLNFLREQVFISGSTEVDQDKLSPKILDSAYKSPFSWQKRPSFLRSNRPAVFNGSRSHPYIRRVAHNISCYLILSRLDLAF
jgi:hypothetical protein